MLYLHFKTEAFSVKMCPSLSCFMLLVLNSTLPHINLTSSDCVCPTCQMYVCPSLYLAFPNPFVSCVSLLHNTQLGLFCEPDFKSFFHSEGHLSSFTFIILTDRFDLSSIATFFNDADFVMFTVFLRGHSLYV